MELENNVNLINVKFEQLGKLNELELWKNNAMVSGVYLWVYTKFKPRIIYVGTAMSQSIFERTCDHYKDISVGLETIFKVKEEQDIYELMCVSDLSGQSEHFKDMAAKGNIWVPQDKIRSESSKCFFKDQYYNDNFQENWSNYLPGYIKNIEIWKCELDSKDLAEILETQLQQALSNILNLSKPNRKIGYWCNIGQNWLGRQQKRGVKNRSKLLANKFIIEKPFPIEDELLNEALMNLDKYLDQ